MSMNSKALKYLGDDVQGKVLSFPGCALPGEEPAKLAHGRGSVNKETKPLSLDMIERVEKYFLESEARSEHLRLRNYCMFICGINFCLRESDLLLIPMNAVAKIRGDGSYTLRDEFKCQMRKTGVSINVQIDENVKTVLRAYLDLCLPLDPERALFYNNGTKDVFPEEWIRCPKKGVTPTPKILVQHRVKGKLRESTVRDIFRKAFLIASDGQIENTGTHIMRKTGVYIRYMNAVKNGDPDALRKAQQLLGHKDPRSTLYYLGVTNQEDSDYRRSVTLGGNLLRERGEQKGEQIKMEVDTFSS